MLSCVLPLDTRTEATVTAHVVHLSQISILGSTHHVMLTKDAFKKLIVGSGILSELITEASVKEGSWTTNPKL